MRTLAVDSRDDVPSFSKATLVERCWMTKGSVEESEVFLSFVFGFCCPARERGARHNNRQEKAATRIRIVTKVSPYFNMDV